jgi:hypothetical protein
MNREGRRKYKKWLKKEGLTEDQHRLIINDLKRKALERKGDLIDFKIDHDIPVTIQEMKEVAL